MQNGKKKAASTSGRGKSNYVKAKGNGKAARNGKSEGRFTKKAYGDVDRETTHDYNDISWYAKNPQILRDLGNISYYTPLGTVISADELYSNVTGDYYVSGFMNYIYIPTIGISEDATSPANLAAQNIYSFVRYMNSGAKNYDMADLMLYFLAMDSVYMLWNYAKRIYGCATVYDQQNWYIPSAIVQAEGIDFSDLVSNLADYRGQLNVIASRISSFCVPAVMPLFIRHSWMCSNIYKDSNNNKAQLIFASPGIYYTYDETGSKYGGRLVPNSTPVAQDLANGAKFQVLLNQIASALNALAYSEDIGVMSGDVLKAYGQDKLFKISPIEPDYTVIPVYNEQVLNQLHNGTNAALKMVGDNSVTSSDTSWVIEQNPNTGFLLFDPNLTNRVLNENGRLINMPWDAPTPEDTMEATRLSLLYDTATQTHIRYCGSEIIANIKMWYYTPSTTGPRNITWAPLEHAIISGPNATFTAQQVQRMARISNFDWHPLVPIVNNTGTETAPVYQFRGYLGDITNYGYISRYTLGQLHLTALLSEFNVPQLGSF